MFQTFLGIFADRLLYPSGSTVQQVVQYVWLINEGLPAVLSLLIPCSFHLCTFRDRPSHTIKCNSCGCTRQVCSTNELSVSSRERQDSCTQTNPPVVRERERMTCAFPLELCHTCAFSLSPCFDLSLLFHRLHGPLRRSSVLHVSPSASVDPFFLRCHG